MKEHKVLFFISSLMEDSTASSLLSSLVMEKNLEVIVFSDIEYRIEKFHLVSSVFDVSKFSSKHNIVPDYIFFVEGGSMNLFPYGLEKMSSINFWYGIDTHMDYTKHLFISRLFDISFIAQFEYIDKLKQRGIEHCYWLPLAFDQNKKPSYESTKKFDLSYIGSMNKNLHQGRMIALGELARRFPNNFIGTASSKKMYEIYAQSKIVFNRSINNDINMRIFESMGSGALCITNPILNNGIEELLEENKHYVTYKDDTELYEKIGYYLNNEDLSKEIAETGQTHVLECHTYSNRISAIFKILSELSHSRKQFTPAEYGPAFIQLGMNYGLHMVLTDSFTGTNLHKKIYLLIYRTLIRLDRFLFFLKRKIKKGT